MRLMYHTNKSLLQIDVENHQDVVVVKPGGRVIRENEAELRTVLERLIAAGVGKIAVDLAMVGYMDSAGLGCCAHVFRLVTERAGGAMAECGASSGLETIGGLIRLARVIPVPLRCAPHGRAA